VDELIGIRKRQGLHLSLIILSMKQKRILYPKLLEAEMGNFTQKCLEGKMGNGFD